MGDGGEPMAAELERIKKYCHCVRAICHTQITKVKIKQKKAHVKEIQINGGTIAEKVGVTKGKGVQGVITRWGVTRLVRKSHRGIRKVGCIGSWHPARVQWQVPRAGQMGYFHRTEINKKIYRIGKNLAEDPNNANTENDLTEKSITPMGGFTHFGTINEDYVMLKGTTPGKRKKIITLRKSLLPQVSRKATEQVTLKFIDTSSKRGHGRFQTAEEKAKFFGTATSKKARKAAEAKEE